MKRGFTRSIYSFLFILCVLPVVPAKSQDQSIARQWNEEVLNAIRNDYARPVVHARNLFHISAAMYDAWASYEPDANPYFLGRTLGSFNCEFQGIEIPEDTLEAQQKAVSYAAYRLIDHRFQNSPGAFGIQFSIDQRMELLGYDTDVTSTDYINGGAAELGNYIADQMIAFGHQDGANEQGNYMDQYYQPVNDSLVMADPGNPNLEHPNRWQPLTLNTSIDQSGNPVAATPEFLGAEWGNVVPFALKEDDITTYTRNGNTYKVYHDPGPPSYIDTTTASGLESNYKWSFCLNAVWASHLDTADNTMWDISPASQGNIQDYPDSFDDYPGFYNFFEGGDTGEGYDVNPVTGEPYEPQIVKRADYARVLAEFWADGPASETPPGHWFVILNTVMDHPLFERRWMGEGPELGPLEYDVKAYLTMGGTVHDAAISSWSAKGWYDYIRPVSALRWMADNGQSTNSSASNFDPAGIPLIPGYIETVETGDPLAGESNENVGKIKLYTWRGHEYIDDPETDVAGVGWILAENWWPYQRPSFVTPPFGGYTSGHSTFSRAAAETMTMMTGSAYFPGGMSEFDAEQNEFLVFEDGPSEDIELQWATYRDASDQCSLSRIWGGIHPPTDDINGRLVGIECGPESFNFADSIYHNPAPFIEEVTASTETVNTNDIGQTVTIDFHFDRLMSTGQPPSINFPSEDPIAEDVFSLASAGWSDDQTFSLTYNVLDVSIDLEHVLIQVADAESVEGQTQNIKLTHPVIIDTRRPELTSLSAGTELVNDQVASQNNFGLTASFDENCDTTTVPQFAFGPETGLDATFVLDEDQSEWTDELTYHAIFEVADNDQDIEAVNVEVTAALDARGNEVSPNSTPGVFAIDTHNPTLADYTVNETVLNRQDIGNSALIIELQFDEPMNVGLEPGFEFTGGNPLQGMLVQNQEESDWTGEQTYQFLFDLLDVEEQFFNLGAILSQVQDAAGNTMEENQIPEQFTIDTQNPGISSVEPSTPAVTNAVDPYILDIVFDEPMDQDVTPGVALSATEDPLQVLSLNSSESVWLNNSSYQATFDVNYVEIDIEDIDLALSTAQDAAGNIMDEDSYPEYFDILLASSGLSQAGSRQQVRVYPSPLSRGEVLNVALHKAVKQARVRMYSATGRAILNRSYKVLEKGTHQFDPGHLPVGIYVLQIKGRQLNASFRIAVSRR